MASSVVLCWLLATAVSVAWLRRYALVCLLVAQRAKRRRRASDLRAVELRLQAEDARAKQQQAKQVQKARLEQNTRDLNTWYRDFRAVDSVAQRY